MKISIITVVYNNRHTIVDAINSVAAQSYKNIEYIVIDGASRDGTLDSLNENGSAITKLISEPDKGIYDAMNKGLKLVTGDIVGILNSDDIYYDSAVLERVANCFSKNPSLDAVYGNLVYVKRNDTNKIVRRWISKSHNPMFFKRGDVPPHPSLFLKATVYQKAGGFDLRYKLAADYEFMLRIFEKFGIKSFHLNLFLVKMRLGGATNKSLKNILSGNKEILLAWKNNGLRAPITLMGFRLFKRIIQFI